MLNRDPKFAAEFLAQVAKATNDYIRAQNREIQGRYVDYLGASAVKATNVEQRQALDTLLLQEERQLMLTEVDARLMRRRSWGWTNRHAGQPRIEDNAIYTILESVTGNGYRAFARPSPRANGAGDDGP